MIYLVQCPFCLRTEDIVRTVDKRDDDMPRCHNRFMKRIFTPPIIFAQRNVHYTSPVDGRQITSRQEHLEELARTDTIVYEEGIRQDQERNAMRREEQLERAIEQTVEKEIATMPTMNRERLAAEMEGGLLADMARITPSQKSFRE